MENILVTNSWLENNKFFRFYLWIFRNAGHISLRINRGLFEQYNALEATGYKFIKDMFGFAIVLAIIGIIIKAEVLFGFAFILFAISLGVRRFKRMFEDEYEVTFSSEIFREYIRAKNANENIKKLVSLKNDEINTTKRDIVEDVEETLNKNPDVKFVHIRHAMIFMKNNPLVLAFQCAIFFLVFAGLYGYSIESLDNERMISFSYYFTLFTGTLTFVLFSYGVYFSLKIKTLVKDFSLYEVIGFYNDALYAGYGEAKASKYVFAKRANFAQ